MHCLLRLKQPSGTEINHNLETSTCGPLSTQRTVLYLWYHYTGVTNYRCSYCLRQSIKQTILQKPINNVLLDYLFIPSMKTNDICFKIKFNLLKT